MKIKKRMTINELIFEYEKNMNITLSKREKTIFEYAYFIGKANLDHKILKSNE